MQAAAFEQFKKSPAPAEGQEAVTPPLTYANPYKNMKRPSFSAEKPEGYIPVTGHNIQSTPFEKYKEQSLSTLAPGELLVRLYDEMIKQMRVAVLGIEKNQLDAANNALIKCQTILSTLESSLDMNYELSEKLRDLYIFIAKQLMNANVKKDVKLIDECVPLIRDLRDSFDQAEKESRKTHATVTEAAL